MSNRRRNPVSKSPDQENWAITPLQAILGRRVRFHWLRWAFGIGFMGAIGVGLGVKIGRGFGQPRRA